MTFLTGLTDSGKFRRETRGHAVQLCEKESTYSGLVSRYGGESDKETALKQDGGVVVETGTTPTNICDRHGKRGSWSGKSRNDVLINKLGDRWRGPCLPSTTDT